MKSFSESTLTNQLFTLKEFLHDGAEYFILISTQGTPVDLQPADF